MRELKRWWRVGAVRKSLWVQWGQYSSVWWQMRQWWRNRHRMGLRYYAQCSLKCVPRDSRACYCPTGRTTELCFEFFGLFFRAQMSRDWTQHPCWCDKINWSYSPDSYADEIAEYGAEKLAAECPWFKPVFSA